MVTEILRRLSKNNMSLSLLIFFAWFLRHSSWDSQNYYVAIWVEIQVCFGFTIQMSLVWESSELCIQNHTKIIKSVIIKSHFIVIHIRFLRLFYPRSCQCFIYSAVMQVQVPIEATTWAPLRQEVLLFIVK